MREEGNFYYSRLSKEEQKVYYAIREGLTALEESFSVPRIDPKRLAEIYFLVRMDHPEIFWSVTYRYRYYAGSANYELVPEYIFPKNRIREHQQALASRIRKLTLPALQMNEREKELYIHDLICEQVNYDKLKKPYSHEIIGALENGTAVCEGMAKAVKALADALGLWCIVVLSEAAPERGIRYRHAWNIVKVGGQYYHLDATFDNTLGKKTVLRHDYVNLSDEQIFRDHEPLIHRAVACVDKAGFYYKENKLSWTTSEEVRKRAAQAVKKNKTLLFHWRGGYLTGAVLTELFEIFREEGLKREKQAAVSVNRAQAVIFVRFDRAESVMELERADEPENPDESEKNEEINGEGGTEKPQDCGTEPVTDPETRCDTESESGNRTP